MNSYDAWKEGRYESENPLEPIKEKDTWDNLTDAYESGHTHAFIDKQLEILHELNVLLEVARATESGTYWRIERLINKCK